MMKAGKHTDNGIFLIDYDRQSSGSSSTCGGVSTKRLKITSESGSSQSDFLSRERKDKIGERVAVLQHLVSPFGKTDTASVLQEASDYIRFLHEQVQVLSSPYLQTSAARNSQGSFSRSSALRSRGLCLVPLSHTTGLASNNGADLWAPKNSSCSPRV